MDKLKKLISRYQIPIKIAFLAVLVYFLGKLIVRNWQELIRYQFSVNISFLLYSFLIGITSYLFQSIAWYITLKKMKVPISFLEGMRGWYYSLLGKYIPGRVFQLLGRVYFIKKQKINRKLIGAGYIIETVMGLFSASFFILIFLIYLIQKKEMIYTRIIFPLIFLLAVCVILIQPSLLEYIINRILKILKKEPIRIKMHFSDLFILLTLAITAMGIYGFSFYFFIKSFWPVTISSYFILIGSFCLYSIINILAFFSPNGLGIGELSLIYLLGRMLPTSLAIIISIALRIFILLIEIATVGIVLLLDNLFFKTRREKG
ncbi:MAG: lysylphosphatidylglycerol synthase transmembrane domain-containing protein [bacterium]|nr:lysylphosphatidylglycerol synthase transmembrane domain-containing protein [bacterium]